LGRFRVKEDADFLALAKERFGFAVELSDVKAREGSGAANYQLIELCWPEQTAELKLETTVGSHTGSGGGGGGARGGSSSSSSIGGGGGGGGGGGVDDVRGALVLDAQAFGRLQRALASVAHGAQQQQYGELD
jgi:hypothetical protein